jgi:hypothetical protein
MSGTLDLPKGPYTPNQPVRTKDTTPGTKYSDAKPVDTKNLFPEALAAQNEEEAKAKAAKAKAAKGKGGKSRRRKTKKARKVRKTRRSRK